MTDPAQSPVLEPFGKYLLDQEIARGGMARVYLARLRGLGGFEKRLVVKQVRPELARDPRFVRMFVEEAKTLVQMSHPNVVPVYELGVVDGVYFLAMEYVEGATLDAILRGGLLPPALVAHVGVQVCDALAYAHERFALVHRDVTPRNVIVDARGHTRLLDFGIAAPVEGTGTGEVFGSVGYMSPEQARGEELGPASDLFSLGAVLYEALTGERAFLAPTVEQTQAALLEAPPPRLEGRDGVPPKLAAIVDALLATEPGARPAGAAEVGRRLRGWLAVERPEGVAPEVGARAEAARAQKAEAHHPAERAPGERRDPSGVVRTIATSAALEALIDEGEDPKTPPSGDEVTEGTVPLARASAAPAPPTASALPAASAPPDDGPEPSPEHTVPLARASHPPAPDRPPREAPPTLAPPAPRSLLGRVLPLALALGLGAAVVLLARPWLAPAAPASARPDVHRSEPTAPPSHGPAPERPASPATGGAASSQPHPRPDPPASAHPRGDGTPAPAPAWLTVNASPWAEVRLDGRSLGNTPRRRQGVAPGAHVLELRCPPLGRTAHVSIHTTSGATTRVIADLSTDPPTVTVR